MARTAAARTGDTLCMELTQTGRRLHGYQRMTLTCPWCKEVSEAQVRINVQNHDVSGGEHTTTWSIATVPSRILTSHACRAT